jgi:acyl carrier protein
MEMANVAASTEQLIGQIRDIFANKLAIEVSSPTVDLIDMGLVDSVSLVELLLALEQRFGMSFPLENLEMDDFRSITSIAEMIKRSRPTGDSSAFPLSSLPVPVVDASASASGAAA